MKLRNFKDNDTASLLLILPVTLAFVIVGAIFGAEKLGMDIPSFLLEPVFQAWLIIMGVVIAGCIWMRQIFLMLAIVGISGLAIFGYYIMYIL